MKMYNRFIILIIICFSTNVLLSQVNVTLITNPNPPAQLSEWVNQTGLAFFTVNNTDLSLQGAPYKIQVDMYTEDNTLVVTTNNNVILGGSAAQPWANHILRATVSNPGKSRIYKKCRK